MEENMANGRATLTTARSTSRVFAISAASSDVTSPVSAKNGINTVNEKLKELTGHDSFEKLSKEKANEAIEALTAASMSEF